MEGALGNKVNGLFQLPYHTKTVHPTSGAGPRSISEILTQSAGWSEASSVSRSDRPTKTGGRWSMRCGSTSKSAIGMYRCWKESHSSKKRRVASTPRESEPQCSSPKEQNWRMRSSRSPVRLGKSWQADRKTVAIIISIYCAFKTHQEQSFFCTCRYVPIPPFLDLSENPGLDQCTSSDIRRRKAAL